MFGLLKVIKITQMPELQCLKQQRKKNDVDDLDGNHNFDQLVDIFKKI